MPNFKNELKSINTGELKVASTTILDKMIENIGSTDSVLRDKLIYTAFYTLIAENHMDKLKLEYILNKLLENRSVVLNIDKPMTDAVFTRSFTTLVYALVVEYDSTKQIICEDLIRKVIDTTHEYMEKEFDLRGFVENKGWAHAVAHGADLLDSIIKHPATTEEDAIKVVQHIARFLTIAHGYQDNEEERLARAFVTLTQHHLNEEFLFNQLTLLEKTLTDQYTNNKGELQAYYALLAFKNFLQSTYFLFVKKGDSSSFQDQIKEMIIRQMY